MTKAFKGLLTGKNQWGSFPDTQPVRTGCLQCLRMSSPASVRTAGPSRVPFIRHPLLQVLSMDGAGGAIFSKGLLRQMDFRRYRDCVTSKAGLKSPLRCAGEGRGWLMGMQA